jgi:hypothetical protein
MSVASEREDLGDMPGLGAALATPALLRRVPLGQYAGSIALIVSGGIAVATGFLSPDLGTPLSFAGLLLATPGCALLVRRALRGGRLAAYESGLVYLRGERRTALAFADMHAFRWKEEALLSHGVYVGIARSVSISGPAGRLAFEGAVRDGQPDPIKEALARAVAGAAQAAMSRVASGGTLAGRGWRLDARGLAPRTKGAVPLPEITGVGFHQGDVCVWKGDEEEPFLRTPSASVNAGVLQKLLARFLEGRPRPEPGGVGRLLFETRADRWMLGLAVLLVPGLLIGAFALRHVDRTLSGVMGVAGIVLALGMAIYIYTHVRVHERAIVRRGVFGRRALLFADIDGVRYAATRRYYNGAYVGTTLELTCRAPGRRPITLSTRVRGGGEADLALVRDHLARSVAARLQSRLEREGEASWAGGLVLSREGLRFCRTKLWGRGDEVRLGWIDVRTSLHQGYLHIFEPGQRSSTFRLACASENFYAGLILFERLRAEALAVRR